MRFSVVTADEAETFYEGEFKLGDGGFLCIYPVEDDQSNVYISPAFWRKVTEIPLEASVIVS